MSKFQCKCPACQTALRLTIQSPGKIKTKCPTCHHSFTIAVPDAAGSRQPASGPPTLETDSGPEPGLFDLPSTDLPASAPIRTYHSTPQTAKTTRNSGKRPLLRIPASWLSGGVGLIVLVAAVAVVLTVDMGDLRPTAVVKRLQAKLDSAARIKRDLESLSKRVETVGRLLPASSISENGCREASYHRWRPQVAVLESGIRTSSLFRMTRVQRLAETWMHVRTGYRPQ